MNLHSFFPLSPSILPLPPLQVGCQCNPAHLPPSLHCRVAASAIRPISLSDFGSALSVIKPSCDKAALAALEEWTQQYGTQ